MGGGWLKTSYGGMGLAEKSKYRNIRGGVGWKRQNAIIWGRGSKIAQKTVIWYL